MEYLGHAISVAGIRPKMNLISAVKEFPKPLNKEEIKSFLGLAEYMSKYVSNFADRVHPLRSLLK